MKDKMISPKVKFSLEPYMECGGASPLIGERMMTGLEY